MAIVDPHSRPQNVQTDRHGSKYLKRVATLMDVAGGHGLLLATVLRRHKMMRGVLFDLPHVAAGAHTTFTRAGITRRVRIESGDFFKELPSGADAIIMKHIIYDWDDESATSPETPQFCRVKLDNDFTRY